MNPEVLKNNARERLVDALIIGGNVIRWVEHQVSLPGAPPIQPASIEYFEGELPDDMDRKLIVQGG